VEESSVGGEVDDQMNQNNKLTGLQDLADGVPGSYDGLVLFSRHDDVQTI
jgi:hypothetical protein